MARFDTAAPPPAVLPSMMFSSTGNLLVTGGSCPVLPCPVLAVVSPCCPPQPSPGGRERSRGGFGAVQALLCYQHCSVISAALASALRHSIVLAAAAKISFIPTTAGTAVLPQMELGENTDFSI